MNTATVNNQAIDDIYTEAMAAPVASRNFFGCVILVDVWPCVLQKGVGKVAYDPLQHAATDKRVAIVIHVEVQGRDGAYTIKQDKINTSKEWAKFTLPSLNAIGANLPDEAACKAASDAFYGQKTAKSENSAAPLSETDLDANNQAGRLERDQLATQFLPVLWQAAGKTKAPFLSMIAANPLLAKHFNEQSPEILRITGDEAAPF
jgi:hypothetical protein